MTNISTTKLDFILHNNDNSNTCLLFIHGLFGDKANLGIIERHFRQNFTTLSIDLRNHGKSFHSDDISYESMAQDVFNLTQSLDNLGNIIVIGHSMGGKVAMQYVCDFQQNPQAKHNIITFVSLDMAPVSYPKPRHKEVFAGLFEVVEQKPKTRTEATAIMLKHLDKDSAAFLLKSYRADCACFAFNLDVLYKNYMQILKWNEQLFERPCLIIKGGDSNYVTDDMSLDIAAQFPLIQIEEVKGAAHWLHAQKPQECIKYIEHFLIQIKDFL